MGIFSKPTKWIKKQTHGGLKKGLSVSGLTSTIKGAAKNPLTYAALLPFAAPALGALGSVAMKGASMIPGAGKIVGAAGWLKDKMGGGAGDAAQDAAKGFLGIEGGDWLNAIGEGVGGYMDSEAQARALAETKRQYDASLKQRQAEAATASGQFDKNFNEDQARFGRTQGNAEAQAAVQAQTALNKAPMADNAQALLMARMANQPTTFKPRDWTHGIDTVKGEATGGPADALAAGRKAAAGYTPGAGGVDTSALEMLKQRLQGSSGTVPKPSAPPMPRQVRPQMGVARRPSMLVR